VKQVFLIFVLLALIVSCSRREKNYTIEEVNGVKVYKNINKPSVKELDISIKELFKIHGIDETAENAPNEFIFPFDMDVDNEGKIFIVDYKTGTVKKFGKNGKFAKSFGKKGDGPGEMRNPTQIAILNNIVFVVDPGSRRILKFDKEGNFIEIVKITAGIPSFLQLVEKDKFICVMYKYKVTEKGPQHCLDLVLTNFRLEEICTLRENPLKADPGEVILDTFNPYTIGDNKIFVAENSEDKYKINVFDFSGKLLYSIEKEYNKILFKKEEFKEMENTYWEIFKNSTFLKPIKAKYKKSIHHLYCDKEGRLLVVSSVERNASNRYDFLVDVFKDGVFLKKVSPGICKGYDFFQLRKKIIFKGNNIYYLNTMEAELTVFEY
jgi:hypothetical protein